MRALQWYLLGAGSWFVAHGIQSVLFAWLVTIVLQAPASQVGIAQMSMLLPSMLLLLVVGWLADRFGGRRLAIVSQVAACVPTLALAGVLATGNLTFATLVLYALGMGTAQAFLAPARDGLLSEVAGGRIQRTVVLVSMIQFGVQILGFALSAQAERIGGTVVLVCQALVLGAGAIAYARVPAVAASTPRHQSGMLASIVEGGRTVWNNHAMRTVMLVNAAVATFFMGSYIVAIPLLVREQYGGSSASLAWLNVANVIGLILTNAVLYHRADVQRRGRVMLIAHFAGASVLWLLGTGLPLAAAAVVIGIWGATGGVAMSMARTIMQQQAPDDQRGRVMAFYSLSFMGAGPVGALLTGWLAEAFGAAGALFVAAASMAAITALTARASPLWRQRF